MSAQIFVKIHVDWLFKLTNHWRHLSLEGREGDTVVDSNAKIAVALFPTGEQWCATAQINQYITAGLNAVTAAAK